MPRLRRMACQGPRGDRLRRRRPRHARPPDGGRSPEGGLRPLGAVLRALRRAAGRSDRALGQRPLRAHDRDRARRLQGDPRPRHRRRQGPAHDLRRGMSRLEGRHRQPADPGHGPARGRGGIRRRQPAALPRRPCRRAPGRRGADLRHQHVGRRHPGGHHQPARHGHRGDHHPRRRPRPAFGVLRLGRGQPEPHPRGDFGRPAGRRRPDHAAGLL